MNTERPEEVPTLNFVMTQLQSMCQNGGTIEEKELTSMIKAKYPNWTAADEASIIIRQLLEIGSEQNLCYKTADGWRSGAQTDEPLVKKCGQERLPNTGTVLHNLNELGKSSPDGKVDEDELAKHMLHICPTWRADNVEAKSYIQQLLEVAACQNLCYRVSEGIWKHGFVTPESILLEQLPEPDAPHITRLPNLATVLHNLQRLCSENKNSAVHEEMLATRMTDRCPSWAVTKSQANDYIRQLLEMGQSQNLCFEPTKNLWFAGYRPWKQPKRSSVSDPPTEHVPLGLTTPISTPKRMVSIEYKERPSRSDEQKIPAEKVSKISEIKKPGSPSRHADSVPVPSSKGSSEEQSPMQAFKKSTSPSSSVGGKAESGFVSVTRKHAIRKDDPRTPEILCQLEASEGPRQCEKLPQRSLGSTNKVSSQKNAEGTVPEALASTDETQEATGELELTIDRLSIKHVLDNSRTSERRAIAMKSVSDQEAESRMDALKRARSQILLETGSACVELSEAEGDENLKSANEKWTLEQEKYLLRIGHKSAKEKSERSNDAVKTVSVQQTQPGPVPLSTPIKQIGDSPEGTSFAEPEDVRVAKVTVPKQCPPIGSLSLNKLQRSPKTTPSSKTSPTKGFPSAKGNPKDFRVQQLKSASDRSSRKSKSDKDVSTSDRVKMLRDKLRVQREKIEVERQSQKSKDSTSSETPSSEKKNSKRKLPEAEHEKPLYEIAEPKKVVSLPESPMSNVSNQQTPISSVGSDTRPSTNPDRKAEVKVDSEPVNATPRTPRFVPSPSQTPDESQKPWTIIPYVQNEDQLLSRGPGGVRGQCSQCGFVYHGLISQPYPFDGFIRTNFSLSATSPPFNVNMRIEHYSGHCKRR